MTIDLQQLINSSISLRLASALARSMPPRPGYRIACGIAALMARRRNSGLIRAVRANQWVVSGGTLDARALDQAVQRALRYSAHSLFDLYHYLHDHEATRRLIVFDQSFQPILQRREREARGLVIAGLHLSSFDLILQWLCKDDMKLLVLTIPDPQGARRVEYELRRQSGMNLIPASVAAFRQALRHLQKGGMVLTGIDRPVENPDLEPHFFGYPAALPVHHVFLAARAHVPIVITVAYLQPDGTYHVFASDPIEMDACSNPEQTMLHNTEKVLVAAEEYIRRAPQQWSVPLPVWPRLIDRVPA